MEISSARKLFSFMSVMLFFMGGDEWSVNAAVAAGTSGVSTASVSVHTAQPYQDENIYSSDAGASLPISAVNEDAAITHHQITLNEKTIRYTATAGHLTATDATTKAPKASFFYVAYTVDRPPVHTRPIMFLYNGGPGLSTAGLHLGSFGPKRLQVGAADSNLPTSFPFVDNAESLLDVIDLVFVDAVGTGYSQAIAPNTNQIFWRVDADAAVFHDFVIRYLEVNQRKDSPKYLFGESYGTTRTGMLANLLEASGVKLTGIVLQSAVLNLNHNCFLVSVLVDEVENGTSSASCASYLPSYAMVGTYYRRDSSKSADWPKYAEQIRLFTKHYYSPAVNAHLTDKTLPSLGLLMMLARVTGTSEQLWRSNVNLLPTTFDNTFQMNLLPGETIGRYDGRIHVPVDSPLAEPGDPSMTYLAQPLADTMDSYLPNELKYTAGSPYVMENSIKNSDWDWSHNDLPLPDVIPDLAAALRRNPSLKILALSGYYDLATPFYQTELDLARLDKRTNLTIKNYAGGHMLNLDDQTRPQQKKDVADFIKTLRVMR